MSSVVKGITSIFKAPKIPDIPTPKMPDFGSFANTQAARKRIDERRKKKGGRDSTIKTAGTIYGGSNLGGTA